MHCNNEVRNVAYRRHEQRPLFGPARQIVWQRICAEPVFSLLPENRRRALEAITRRVGSEGWFVFKHAEWAAEIGTSTKTIQRIVKQLIGLGFISECEPYHRPRWEGSGANGAPNYRLNPKFLALVGTGELGQAVAS